MIEHDLERPLGRTAKRRAFRISGDRKQPTPEELAARIAAETAAKLDKIFARTEAPQISK